MSNVLPSESPGVRRPWITRTVLAIVLATFFSDVSHEMCTAVLPLYLATVGLGPAALGLIEGVADFLVSLSKLAGGYVGHHVERKRPWASLGYLVTTLGTWGIAFVGSLAAVLMLRSAAWVGRGFRSPLRDFMLADAVEQKYFGRAYGLERAGDMLGAVVGPLLAFLLLWAGVEFRTIILWTIIPGVMATGAFFFFTKDKTAAPASKAEDNATPAAKENTPIRNSQNAFGNGGLLLEAGYTTLAFSIAAGVGAVGVCWMLWLIRKGTVGITTN